MLRLDRFLGPEAQCKFAPRRYRLDNEHPDTNACGLSDNLETHDATGDHHKAPSGAELGLGMDSMEAVDQRLDEYGAIARQIVGNAQWPARPGNSICRDQRIIGIAAINIAIKPVAGAPAGYIASDRRHMSEPFVAG